MVCGEREGDEADSEGHGACIFPVEVKMCKGCHNWTFSLSNQVLS